MANIFSLLVAGEFLYFRSHSHHDLVAVLYSWFLSTYAECQEGCDVRSSTYFV